MSDLPGIYYATKRGIPIGPYHMDEISAQQHAKHLLGYGSGVQVYRIEAKSFNDARAKARTI